VKSNALLFVGLGALVLLALEKKKPAESTAELMERDGLIVPNAQKERVRVLSARYAEIMAHDEWNEADRQALDEIEAELRAIVDSNKR
jgi:hypothetical protein